MTRLPFAFFIFWGLAAATSGYAQEKPVLAVAPVAAPDLQGTSAAVTSPLNAKLVELARDSGEFAVFDQDDIETVLRMQKQGASPVMADPVAFGRLVAARKVLTAELRRAGGYCSLGLKITDVETGLVEGAKLEVGGCALPELLALTGGLWSKLIAAETTIVTVPAGLLVRVDGGPPLSTPAVLRLAAGRHDAQVATPGYAQDASGFTLRYQERRSLVLRGVPQRNGRVRITGAPVGAAVFEGARRLGSLPLEIELAAGTHAFDIETDAGRYAREVTVAANRIAELRVDLPFQNLESFNRHFVAANQAGRDGNHQQAAVAHDEALRSGLSAMAQLPPDLQPELQAALTYVEGARLLSQAWLLQPKAQSGGEELEAYCRALESAALKFTQAAAAAPAQERLALAANQLARKRAPLKLGACAPEVRFPKRLREVRWPAALTPESLRGQAGLNRSLLAELKRQAGLSPEQQRWLKAEDAMLLAYERWLEMLEIKAELLKSPATALPRMCALQKQALGYAEASRKELQGVRAATFPMAERLAEVEALQARARNEGSLCAQ